MENRVNPTRWNSNVRWLYADQMLSTLASTAGTFILSWMLYEQTGSKTAMGALWLISILSQWIVQFVVGPLIDRWKRTAMMRLSEVIRGSAYLSVFIFWEFGYTQAFMLYIASSLTSFVVYDSAASALIPKIVHPDQFTQVNARISGGVQLVRLLALPLAGYATQMWKVEYLLLVIVFMFMASYISLGFIVEKVQVTIHKSWLEQFKKGLAVYKQHRILLALGLFVSVTSFGVFSTQAMYIPYVKEILGGDSLDYGLFLAAFPFGYVIGSYVVGKIKEPKVALYRVMLAALFIGGVTYILLGFTTNIAIALLIEMVAGISMPFWNVYSSTLYYRRVEESILAQVLSVRFLLTKVVTPLGIVYGTFCADTFGLPQLFWSVGILITLVSGFGLLFARREGMKYSDSIKL